MSKRKLKPESKKKIIIGAGAVALLLLLIIIFLALGSCNKSEAGVPTLTIETPQKLSIAQAKEFTLDVSVSTLGDSLYPAASMSIAFDPTRLEFLGIEEGNVLVLSDSGNVAQKLPQWSCNPEQCNKTGKINLMYLDTTGGRNAFSKNLLNENDNVIVRLKLRLRGSARSGDAYDLIFEDAVFAASDEAQSLAMTTASLKTKNGKIVVGE